MNTLKIEYIDIEKLNHYSENAKLHTAEQIKHIAKSIEQFGFNDPIGIAGDNNIILEGNGRIEAAKLLGMTKLPCVRLDHLSESEQRAYVIAHNSLNLETGFDEVKLMEELKALQLAFDFNDFGLNMRQFEDQMSSLQKTMLKPYKKVHYLITLDININDRVIDIIDSLKNIEGVEVESSLN